MKSNRIIVLSTLTFAVGVAFAQGAARPTPAGEGVSPSYLEPSSVSQTTRAAVRSDVLQARLAGALIPAGVGSPAYGSYDQRVASQTSRSRNQVKTEVLQARADGALIPAGQAVFYGAAPTVRATPSHSLLAARKAK